MDRETPVATAVATTVSKPKHGRKSSVGSVGTCHGWLPQPSMTLGVLFPQDDRYYSASSCFKSSKLVRALNLRSPVEQTVNHQYMGFLLSPRGPVMTASLPYRGSPSRVMRILLPTIFLSKAWYLASPSSICLCSSSISNRRAPSNWSVRASISACISLEVFLSDMTSYDEVTSRRVVT